MSRTVVNEVERGRRIPSLRTYDRLRTALGLDLPATLALLPSVAPSAPSERFLTTLAAALITGRRVALADLAVTLGSEVSAVRSGVVQLSDRLTAVGLAAVDDGVHVEVAVLAHTAELVSQVAQLDAVRTLTAEALTALVIIGDLGEATRREVDERRGTDSSGLLDRLVERGLLAKRSDHAGVGRPNAYRLTARTLTVLGHATVESFQSWCRLQVALETDNLGSTTAART